MLNLGTLSIEDFQKIDKILGEQLQDLQNENSPYIVISKLNDNQVIVLEKLYRKGSYELLLMEVRAPGADTKDIEPVSDKDYNTAQKIIQDAIKKALNP